jgi:uncharacterized protein (DUF1501 family)
MSSKDSPRIDRRGFVALSAGGLLAALASRFGGPVDALAQTAVAAGPAPARACILLWMNGGPSHIDTFDPKPGRPTGGPFKAIKTSAPGVQICEHLPQLAAEAHRLAIVRSMQSKEGNHVRAQYLVRTGYAPTATIDHPALGSWVSAERGDPALDLPQFVSLGGPSVGPGFLGLSHGAFVVPDPGSPPRNMASPARGDDARFDRRRAALAALEDDFARKTADPKVIGRREVYDKAVRMMRSSHLGAFDISSEPASVREAYGDSDFGRACLTARRLVEAGVRFVEVSLDGWDTHKNNFERTRKLMGVFDPAMATLLRELDARKLLDSTMVAWMGEFGRTPRIDGDDGRDHHPRAWSAVLAGGGLRGGVAYGATDEDGAKVVDRAVGVPDLLATMAQRMGIDPAKSVATPSGRPITVTENGMPIAALIR